MNKVIALVSLCAIAASALPHAILPDEIIQEASLPREAFLDLDLLGDSPQRPIPHAERVAQSHSPRANAAPSKQAGGGRPKELQRTAEAARGIKPSALLEARQATNESPLDSSLHSISDVMDDAEQALDPGQDNPTAAVVLHTHVEMLRMAIDQAKTKEQYMEQMRQLRKTPSPRSTPRPTAQSTPTPKPKAKSTPSPTTTTCNSITPLNAKKVIHAQSEVTVTCEDRYYAKSIPKSLEVAQLLGVNLKLQQQVDLKSLKKSATATCTQTGINFKYNADIECAACAEVFHGTQGFKPGARFSESDPCPVLCNDGFKQNADGECKSCDNSNGRVSVWVPKKGDCTVEFCKNGFQISADAKKCESCRDKTEHKGAKTFFSNDAVGMPECRHDQCKAGYHLDGSSTPTCTECDNKVNVKKFDDSDTAGECVVKTCMPGYVPTTDKTRCTRAYAGSCQNGALIKEQAHRVQENHCGSCNSGYELHPIHHNCTAYAGNCTNGVIRNLEDRTADNQCGTCNSGFLLDTHSRMCRATDGKQAPPKCVNVTVSLTAQQYAEEIFWRLTDEAQASCFVKAADYEAAQDYPKNFMEFRTSEHDNLEGPSKDHECCLQPGTITVQCEDSYSDGWHGGHLNLANEKLVCKAFHTAKETLNVTLHSNKAITHINCNGNQDCTAEGGDGGGDGGGDDGTLAGNDCPAMCFDEDTCEDHDECTEPQCAGHSPCASSYGPDNNDPCPSACAGKDLDASEHDPSKSTSCYNQQNMECMACGACMPSDGEEGIVVDPGGYSDGEGGNVVDQDVR